MKCALACPPERTAHSEDENSFNKHKQKPETRSAQFMFKCIMGFTTTDICKQLGSIIQPVSLSVASYGLCIARLRWNFREKKDETLIRNESRTLHNIINLFEDMIESTQKNQTHTWRKKKDTLKYCFTNNKQYSTPLCLGKAACASVTVFFIRCSQNIKS